MTSTKVWQKIEISLTAQNEYENPYTDVTVWVDLKGPGYSKRVYGFWNNGQNFVVRVLATDCGTWCWSSGSSANDGGLNGQSGSFDAMDWSDAEKNENPNRRGMVQATKDGRALQYADGTPYFMLGDTWWSLPSRRFKLVENDDPQPLGPSATLNDYAHFRKNQGFNCIGILAAQPAWANDGHPPIITADDGTCIRAAWKQPGTASAKDMDNEGGRPFEFPGKVPGYEDVVPDLDRINPEYFKVLDAKIDYLNGLGFVPFIEVARRDTGQVWQKYHDFAESYSRYVQYIFARYQANITILSPIHYDFYEQSIPARDYNEPCNLVIDRYGKPPFGTLLSANPNPSTLVNFGGADECRWLDLHQIGNMREHHSYWHLTEIFQSEPVKPAINGEPYYAGLHQLGDPYPLRTDPNSERDEAYVRSGLYGSFLSGGLGGVIYGAEGIWQSDTEDGAMHYMWDSFQWRSADQVRHLAAFANIRGTRYTDLIPQTEMLVPNKSSPSIGYTGWGYAAGTKAQDFFLVFFEIETSQEAELRSLVPDVEYAFNWFDPRGGTWTKADNTGIVRQCGRLTLPERPDHLDWGLMLERV